MGVIIKSTTRICNPSDTFTIFHHLWQHDASQKFSFPLADLRLFDPMIEDALIANKKADSDISVAVDHFKRFLLVHACRSASKDQG
jgi:hypothetical protein